ncbi:MAG: tetratricopeptide repeat protein [Mycobacteriales bacterium]
MAERSFYRMPSGPALPDDMDIANLDPAVRSQLRVLPKEVAEIVAKHLIMAGRLLNTDPAGALAHAQAARSKAPRFGVVREAVAEAAYHSEDWHAALMELRAARRVSGNDSYLPMIIDCERALGRVEKAWELLRQARERILDVELRAELAILASGMHREVGNLDAALTAVAVPELRTKQPSGWLARLRYSYADVLAARGDYEQARTWFEWAVDADLDEVTDAGDRLLELDGVSLHSEPDDIPEADGSPSHQ